MVMLSVFQDERGIMIRRRVNHYIKMTARLYCAADVLKCNVWLVGAHYDTPAQSEVELPVKIGTLRQDVKQVQFLDVIVETARGLQGVLGYVDGFDLRPE